MSAAPSPADLATSNATPRRQSLEAWITICIFCICIATPALMQVSGYKSIAVENRALAPSPGWPKSWSAFLSWPQRIQSFLDDRFGFRSQMVWLNSRLRYALGVSTSSAAVLGTHGFLYYAYEPERLMEQHTGEDVFSPKTLATWIDAIAANSAWLAKRGIAYYVVVAPDKSTIYPEYLPDFPVLPNSTTRLDQLVSAIAGRSDIILIDPRAAIAAQKPAHRMYTRTDSHWGPRAAFVAYSMLMDRIRQRLPTAEPVRLEDYEITQSLFRGDLAYLMHLYDDLQHREDRFVPKFRSHVLEIKHQAPEAGWGWPITQVLTDRDRAPRILIMGDSFTDYVMGPLFLYETFKDPVYTHHNGTLLDRSLIERTKPNVVVHEFAERYLALP